MAAESAGAQVAQFELPKTAPGTEAPQKLPDRLIYEYTYGSESSVFMRRDADLNRDEPDNTVIVNPELHGHIIYRPTRWLETKAALIFDREIPAQERELVNLPNGETQVAPDRGFTLAVDEAYFTIKDVIDPLELTFGRRNYEDERHWLYDTSIDVVRAGFRVGKFQTESFFGRENAVDITAFKRDPTNRINTYLLYTDYRGVEDIRMAAYTIYRDDRSGAEGSPLTFGLRSQGNPIRPLSYWAELAHMRGTDEFSREFSGYGLDVGGTYRFLDLPLNPNITLGYAYGSGDGDPDDGTNYEFRQTGLQSNETKFGGVSEFKTYGEALDPELSNLQILTAGVGIRPTPYMSVDVVYHRYLLNKFAEELRNSGITALMNQDPSRMSKDVGSALDVVVGFRNLFGVRRLGLDLRGGLFFPGRAFVRNEGDEVDPDFRNANKGLSVNVKFWW